MKKVVSFYPEPKINNIEPKNLKFHLSTCIEENLKNIKTRLKIKDYNSCLEISNHCLELDPKCIQAILYKFIVFMEINDYHRGISNLILAQQIENIKYFEETLAFKTLKEYYINQDFEKREIIKEKVNHIKSTPHLMIVN